MVTSSSSLRATVGFTRPLTSGSRGISRGARKLAQTSTVIKKKDANFNEENQKKREKDESGFM